jgi:hypothetical protein
MRPEVYMDTYTHTHTHTHTYTYIRQELLDVFSHFSYETSEHKLVVAHMQHLCGDLFSDPCKALSRLYSGSVKTLFRLLRLL